MATVAGADGCRGGWIWVRRDPSSGDLDARVAESAGALLSAAAACAVLAVDIPIGLTESGRRGCDTAARAALGWPRRNSVFPAPIRPALAAPTRDEASEITFRIDGRRVGVQAWGIWPKIRDMDAVLRSDPGRARRVYEVHPEVCFWALNAQSAMQVAKKKAAGRDERRRVIDAHFGADAVERARQHVRGDDVAPDDVLDAFAALWTAERIHRGVALSLPDAPPVDSVGLPMAIWY